MKSRYGLEIRAATAADAPGLAELLAAGGHKIDPAALATRLDAVRHGPGTALIAAEWGPPSGMIELHWFATLAADHRIARITALLVAPDDRRRGIGRLLVKAAAQAARVAGCNTLELQTTPGQDNLDPFCRATGFLPTGTAFARALRKGQA